MQFPYQIGHNLEGRRFELPRDFAGDSNLVMIAFEQWQQRWVDTWMPFIQQMKAQYDNIAAYELPVINRLGWIRERMLDYGMRLGIPDKSVRESTITLYTDVAQFCAALRLPTTRTIYVLLVDRDGEVRAGVEGRYVPETGLLLREAIAQRQHI
ncbi:MAG: hypothetical protein NZM00_07825 [Anaerolinea sp.]|nr:hypothetical protein [Anaerolinea sp.]